MRKRNIVCFVSSYPPNIARVSEYAKALLTELSKRPTISKINVIADVAKGVTKSEQKGKILIHRLWKPDNVISILSILPLILKMNPDIVHFNVAFGSFGKSRIVNFVGLSLGFICNILGKKTLITIHNFGEMVDLNKCYLKPSLINRMGIILVTKLISMVSCVTVTVRFYINYLQTRYKTKNVLLVPHGVWKSEYKNLDFANYSNINKKILAFGHMGPYKGLPILLTAFNMLVNERSDIELLVGGTSHPNYLGFLDNFKKLESSNVKFLGYVDEDELPNLFHEVTVVILPYLTMTGTSGVFHLACSFGKPIIASDLPETRALIKEGAHAFLVPAGQLEELRDAIRYVLDNPKRANDIGHRNYSYARRNTWDKIAEKFEKIYCTL